MQSELDAAESGSEWCGDLMLLVCLAGRVQTGPRKRRGLRRADKRIVEGKNRSGFVIFLVTYNDFQVGTQVEAKHPEKGQFIEGIISKIQDCSQYTVGNISFYVLTSILSKYYL